MEGNVQVTNMQIKYCQNHYDELIFALTERGMGNQLCENAGQLAEKLQSGKMDPGLEASTAITQAAMSMFGPEILLNNDGCPVCAIYNVITHVADHMATKYLKSN